MLIQKDFSDSCSYNFRFGKPTQLVSLNNQYVKKFTKKR